MNEPIDISLEEQLCHVVAKFHFEQQGHSPVCTSTILPSMAIVHSLGVFTSTESELKGTHDGKKLIQSARREQRTLTRRDIERQVSKVLKREVRSSFYDLDVRSGEQIEIYMLGSTDA